MTMTSVGDINSTFNMHQDSKPTGETSQKAKEVVTEFCSETTAHGPAHVAHETNRVMKFIWLAVFICALIGLGFHLSVIITKYLSRPTQQLMYVSADPPSFPHITVCNHNPVSETNVQNLYQSQPVSNTSWFHQEVTRLKPRFEFVSSTIGHIDDLFGSTVSYFENIGEAEATSISHKWKDFIIDCTYAQVPCTEEDFDVFFHPMYFNCFTFHGENIKKTHPAVGTGPYHGLSLVLYLGPGASSLMNTYNRFSPIGNSVGARIEVHEADHLPQPDINGVDVPPGASTSLSLRSEVTIKETHPFGNCTTRTLPATSLHPALNYSASLCKAFCQQDYVYASCGCYVPTLPYPGQPTCGTFHVSGSTDDLKLQTYTRNMECRAIAEKTYKSDTAAQAKCNCQPECETTRYFSSVSESQWPGLDYQQNFLSEFLEERSDKESLEAYQNFKQYMIGSANPATVAELIEAQFVRANIYFTDLEVLVHKTVPAYEITTMFADVGGTLGLWAGVSIITVLEIFTYAGKLMGAVCCTSDRTKKVEVQAQQGLQSQPTYGDVKS